MQDELYNINNTISAGAQVYESKKMSLMMSRNSSKLSQTILNELNVISNLNGVNNKEE